MRKKAKKILENRREQLGRSIASAERALAEIPATINQELACIIVENEAPPPGIKVGKWTIGLKQYESLPPYKRGLLDSYNKVITDLEKDRDSLQEVESLLQLPKGRSRDAVYEQAFEDKIQNPKLSIRQLAEKYLPNYFPDRAQSATRMMDQGVRRARKRYGNKPPFIG